MHLVQLGLVVIAVVYTKTCLLHDNWFRDKRLMFYFSIDLKDPSVTLIRVAAPSILRIPSIPTPLPPADDLLGEKGTIFVAQPFPRGSETPSWSQLIICPTQSNTFPLCQVRSVGSQWAGHPVLHPPAPQHALSYCRSLRKIRRPIHLPMLS